MKTLAIIVALAVIGGGVIFYMMKKNEAGTRGVSNSEKAAVVESPAVPTMHVVTIKTNLGEIQFETYDADAPKTVANFVTLADRGFYNNLTFHRVIKGFMIQGGDPNCTPALAKGPCGAGGPGYTFEDELNPNASSYQAGYTRGVVAMANAGPNTNGSQFFIMLQDTPLPHAYTIFGKVVSGQDVVDAIGAVKTGAGDRPLNPVVIQSVIVSQK